jgi:hypothetical protein
MIRATQGRAEARPYNASIEVYAGAAGLDDGAIRVC